MNIFAGLFDVLQVNSEFQDINKSEILQEPATSFMSEYFFITERIRSKNRIEVDTRLVSMETNDFIVFFDVHFGAWNNNAAKANDYRWKCPQQL